ncbi:MAG TPA: type II secretion system protein [Candidatus Kaiserbacteria bacterium]|nr:type II secretion system protein [Candidatus Kaiserbacteria bacterium]
MQKKSSAQRGFTLIELLVVIAIIGILSSVVLASLNTARKKGNDAAVKSNLATVQTQAQLYYDDNSNKFSGTGSQVNGTANCDVASTMFSKNATPPTIYNAIQSANKSSLDSTKTLCHVDASGQDYAINIQLSTGDYWCVDSTGVEKTEPAALADGVNKCS